MKRINLRELYPFYDEDFFMDVTEKIDELLKILKRKEHAENEYRRKYKAYYSLDFDGIEKDIILLVLSPEEIYERKLNRQELYAAINSLPEIQAKRLHAHFFLGMSKTEIARVEGVNKSNVSRTIDHALKNIEKFLKNIL